MGAKMGLILNNSNLEGYFCEAGYILTPGGPQRTPPAGRVQRYARKGRTRGEGL